MNKSVNVLYGKRERVKENTFCRLTLHHLFRCQLIKCGLDPERIDWTNPEERAVARECLKKLYARKGWSSKEKHKYTIFYLLELSRRRLKENRKYFKQIRKMRVLGKMAKKLSWEQIWEIIHKMHARKEVRRVGVCTFISGGAWNYRCKKYRINRQMILQMTKEELKEHITNVILERKIGHDWQNALYDIWQRVSYTGTPAQSLLADLEITISDWLGKTFEEFVALIRDRLWERDRGSPSRKEKYLAGLRKDRKYNRPKIDDPVELARVLERTNVRHAILMASERLYGNILSYFKKSVRNITKEELMNYLLSPERRPRVSERSIDSEEELLKLSEVESPQKVLRKASPRLYNSIKEYYRLRGISVKNITKEHIVYYLKLRLAKRDVEDRQELLKILEEWGVEYALRRVSKKLYKNIWAYCKYKGLSLEELTAEDLKYYLCQRARAI